MGKNAAYFDGKKMALAKAPADPPSADPQLKRVNLNLPGPLYDDLVEFAQERGDTMTGLFKWALGLSKAIWDEVKSGNRIRVVTKDGKLVKEFVITPY